MLTRQKPTAVPQQHEGHRTRVHTWISPAVDGAGELRTRVFVVRETVGTHASVKANDPAHELPSRCRQTQPGRVAGSQGADGF